MPAMPNDFLPWLACLAFAAALLNQLAKARTNFLGKGESTHVTPSPLIVAEQERFVPMSQHSETITRINARLGEMDKQREADALVAGQSRAKIYEKMEKAAAATAVEIKTLRQEMHDMELRLNASGETRNKAITDLITKLFGDLGEMRGEVHAKKP